MTSPEPPIKDQSLATGQALFRLRVLRLLDRHAALSRDTACAGWIAELIREVETMEIA